MPQPDVRDAAGAAGGYFVFLATATYPAMQLAGFGFLPDWGIEVYLLISIVGGAVAGALMLRRARLLGMACGALIGPAILVASFVFVPTKADGTLHHKAMVAAPVLFLWPIIVLYHVIAAEEEKRSGRMARSAKRR